MNAPVISAQAVKQHLQQEVINCQQLLTILENEHEILQQRDSLQLQKVVEAKQNLMIKLENGAKLRSRWLKLFKSSGSDTAASQWQHFLCSFEEPELPALWDQLDASLSCCKQQNDANGRMILKGQKTLQQLVGILRGKVNTPAGVYNAKGITDQNRGAHTSVKRKMGQDDTVVKSGPPYKI